MRKVWNFLLQSAATAVGLFIVTVLLGDKVRVDVPLTPLYGNGQYDVYIVFFAIAALLVAVNLIVGPVIRTIGLPLTIVTLGAASFLFNAVLFLLAGTISEKLGLGLHVASFSAALWASVIISIVTGVLSPVTKMLRF